MIKMPRKCINHPDRFCYVCGSFTPKGQVRSITHDIKKMYQLYFKCPLGDQDKSWAPHVICSSCSNGLRDWLNMRKVAMPFAVPMIWREPKNHSDDCYFCFVKLKGFSAKNKHKINYPELESAIRPVSHDDTLPVPVPPVSRLEEIEVEYEDCGSDATGRGMDTSIDDEYVPDGVAEQPERFTQHELNDLIRDLSLSKDKSELLASRLKQKNLLYDDVKVCYYRNRSDTLAQFFTVDGPMVYCNNVNGLFEELNQEYFVADWRLFIDSSQRSLKAVLLHNGNMKPSIPIAHSCHLKESYENMSVVLDAIQYKHHQWNICGDLKVIGLLMGMQGGFTKHCCFLCLWDSRNTEQHYVRRDWGQRNMYAPGRDNVQHNPLVDQNKIFLPPLHIKLGLIKNFVKAMAKTNSQGFQYISQKFSSISPAKLKEGVFVGPQIRELMRDDVFEGTLHDKELRSWKSFKWICNNFLGKNKSQEYVEGVEKLLNAYQSLGCRMSLKMHFLHSHLDFFPPNLGDVSDEQGERFHQDIKLMEHRYQGFWNESMMADYCWMLYRDNPEASFHRQSNVKHF